MPHKWIDGPIDMEIIMPILNRGMNGRDTGAQAAFFGQIRADTIDGRVVKEVEYTSYRQLGDKEFERIEREAKNHFSLLGISIFHSLGKVGVGRWSMVIIVFSSHRKAAFEGLEWIVNHIKSEVPIFGKEIFEDGAHQWKTNQ